MVELVRVVLNNLSLLILRQTLPNRCLQKVISPYGPDKIR